MRDSVEVVASEIRLTTSPIRECSVGFPQNLERQPAKREAAISSGQPGVGKPCSRDPWIDSKFAD